MQARISCILLLLTLGSTVSVHAQVTSDAGPDLSQVPVRLGPVYVDPALSLTNLGVDTNVFNEPDDQSPKSDFTFTVSPAARLWMRMGPTWLSGRVNEDIVWFKKYTGERSGNTSYSLSWTAPLNRLTLFADASWLNTRARPSFEIDARSQRQEIAYRGSVEVRALSKIYLGVDGSRRRYDFDRDGIFLGRSLEEELNRTVTVAGAHVRFALTPLTSLTGSVQRQEDRFEFSRLRDSDSTIVTGGVQFDPDALIKGSAVVGYRRFRPVDPSVPDYRGSTADVSLAYVAGGSTQLSVTANRSLEYSFELTQPYYVHTGVVTQLAQQIYGPVDAVGRFGGQRLAYREIAQTGTTPRTDHVRSVGGGLGYHVGRRMRIGFNVDRQTRTSGVDQRRYSGYAIGTAITYGGEN